MSKTKIPPIVKISAYLLSLGTFIVGFWHAHLGLKNQHFFGSENGSLVIAAIILILILISYYFAVSGRKVALFFYLICAFALIVFNLNYFYPYDFKEDLVKEEAGILKDTLISYSTRAQAIIGVESDVVDDYIDLKDLEKQLISEVRDQNGFKANARAVLSKFNDILANYKINAINPSLAGVNEPTEQARILQGYITSSIESFIAKNLVNSEINLDVAERLFKAKEDLKSLEIKYIPELEFIQRDTTKIDISNDKKNIENNPKNIAKIAKIVSEVNSTTKPINDINTGSADFPKLEATITELGSVGHTLPSIVQHIKNGTKEQKVGTWKNILLVIFLDLII